MRLQSHHHKRKNTMSKSTGTYQVRGLNTNPLLLDIYKVHPEVVPPTLVEALNKEYDVVSRAVNDDIVGVDDNELGILMYLFNPQYTKLEGGARTTQQDIKYRIDHLSHKGLKADDYNPPEIPKFSIEQLANYFNLDMAEVDKLHRSINGFKEQTGEWDVPIPLYIAKSHVKTMRKIIGPAYHSLPQIFWPLITDITDSGRAILEVSKPLAKEIFRQLGATYGHASFGVESKMDISYIEVNHHRVIL